MTPLPSGYAAWRRWILVCLLAIGSVGAAERETWRAGVGREKITPPAGLWMTGYGSRDRPAEGVALDLWVKALAISDPAGNRAVLLTLDLCGITREITDHAAQEIGRKYGLPRSAILANVSHTHCSPFLPGYLSGLRILPPEGMAKATAYARELEQKMIRTASAALDAMAPATLGWSEDEATFAFNRRENREADVPKLRQAGQLKGPWDPRVPVLAVRSPSGELRALLVSYACHNTTLSFFQWHGDYAGCAMRDLEQRHPGATALFAIGCGADMNPGPRGSLPLAEQHGRELADAADRALQRTLQPLRGQLRTAFADITLRFAAIPTAEQLREARESTKANKTVEQAWAATVEADLKAKGDRILDYTYPVQAWNLGGLSWIALGGEVVIDYSFRLRKELGQNTWVLGYCNDVMSYIPSERVLKEGRYEGATSMIAYGKPSPWAPGLEDKIVAKAHEVVAQTK